MRFSDPWLRDCVETSLPPKAVGERLTAVGIPLDSLETFGRDTVYHFDVTSNRPDCMSHLGLARELSVATGEKLKEPPSEAAATGAPVESLASVAVEAPDLCGRYSALVIQAVKVDPSPDWLSRRLQSVGLRPINAVVDATNYVLWEMGHPLHAFDLARLTERAIRVRRARAGERITTLDGVERKLDPEMLVIADERSAVALAGVMGGRDTEISGSTVDVLLESAHFQPASVRRTARKLGLHTDASHRFERGADPEITQRAASRCATLIAELTGGRIARGVLEARPVPPLLREIPLRSERVRQLLGLAMTEETMRSILLKLGCRLAIVDAKSWCVTPPSFRGDLSLEEDLVEEIARHHGYDRIPVTLPRMFVFPQGRSEAVRRLDRVRQAAQRCGFCEALNLSMVSAADNRSFGADSDGMRILNPLTEGQDRLRTSLVPGLLRNLAHNLNRGLPEARLFETGRVFLPSPRRGELPDEEERAAMVLAGGPWRHHWSEPEREPDFFDVKGAVDLAVKSVGLPLPEWRPAKRPFLAPGRGAESRLGLRLLGWAGEVSREVAAAWELEVSAFAAEISLREMAAALGEGPAWRHSPLARTPSVSRDLSLILDQTHPYSEVEAVIRSVEGVPVASVRLFDRYLGPPVPEGKVSMAVHVVFQAPGRTLVSEEVSGYLQRIVQRLRDRLGAVLRGN